MNDYFEAPASNKAKSDNKIELLVREIPDDRITLSENGDPDSVVNLSQKQLSEALFAKAPEEFLEARPLGELKTITSFCYSLVQSFLQKDRHDVRIASEHGPSSSRISIVLGDRPFIINSITECIRREEADLSILLHPILFLSGYRLSCSYIEIEKISSERLDKLTNLLSTSLRDLICVTDDFTSMLVHAESLAKVLRDIGSSDAALSETASFLSWLSDGGLMFLGHSSWSPKDGTKFVAAPSTLLGLCKERASISEALMAEVQRDIGQLFNSSEVVAVTKLSSVSTVHRFARMINISVKKFEQDGKLLEIHSFVGLLTSKAWAQESSTIPLIRQKLQTILKAEEVVENSYDYKNIVNIIDSLPKDETLRLDAEALREIIEKILGVQNRNQTRTSVRFDRAGRGVSIVTLMPQERFNTGVRKRIQSHLEDSFGAQPDSGEYHLDLSSGPLVRFYFYIPLPPGEIPELDLHDLQLKIEELSKSWNERLRDNIFQSQTVIEHEKLWQKYRNAFPEGYQALQSVEDCVHDIELLETLNDDQPLKVILSDFPHDNDQLKTLVVYKLEEELTISKALPMLENVGLEVINEMSFMINPRESRKAFVELFLVKSRLGLELDKKSFEKNVGSGLASIFQGQTENDQLNSLLITAGLDVKAIALLRCYCCFLWQVNKFATRSTIYSALAQNPSMATQLWKLFEIRFNPLPEFLQEARDRLFEREMIFFRDSLRAVHDITKDRILRSLANLLENTLRTNFFNGSAAIALKVSSSQVEIMPQPRPFMEIFVRSPEMEGIHLRAGKISRGGIRWSDRVDDYRTEILGLMKTQNIKNALVVAGGAKGGFVLTGKDEEDPARQRERALAGYSQFIRALLSITDNLVSGQIVHPKDCIIYDEADPYLVVAADKGTATYSDFANSIAIEEFNFWLGDAFASGGSQGYDHKKFGITARGAWECVKRHFNDLGLDYVNKPFTVTGIGDMSGDVFGNGMLLSSKIKLVAAFNHQHIFIDPDPEPSEGFKERKRLFHLPGSKWTDYDATKISKGGGVFQRFSKEIELTPEMRQSLSIAEDVPNSLNGETLIAHILRAKVDLLWNGGIGTYVKSSLESNSDVNDGANDSVRVNAHELRARVIGEGGNLGFTQLARIEFAQNGGLINTDAIDNSGGVDMSDHEVNLKILFAELLRKGKLTLEQRDQILREVGDEVTQSVLQHNKHHALGLTIGVHRSKKSIEYFRSLLKEVVKQGYVSRVIEQLPDDEKLRERIKLGIGLTRPELAICLAAVKMSTKDALNKSALPEDTLLRTFLMDYFPKSIRERFPEEIKSHPLAAQIISTEVTNSLVDAVGITFIHRMCINHSVSHITVIKSALAVKFILELERIQDSISKFDTFAMNETFLSLRKGLSRTTREATAWIISAHGQDLSLDQIVSRYKEVYHNLLQNPETLSSDNDSFKFSSRTDYYQELGLEPFTSKSLALYPNISLVFEILSTALKHSYDVKVVASVFSMVVDILELKTILAIEKNIQTGNKWENELVLNSYEDIRKSLSNLTALLITKGCTDRKAVTTAMEQTTSFERVKGTIEEIKEQIPSVAALSVISKQLRTYQLGKSC